MRRFWPVILMGAGFVILLGGLFYDVMFAGIPYQDPPPELAADYARHARVASVFYRLGAGVLVLGFLFVVIQWMLRIIRWMLSRRAD